LQIFEAWSIRTIEKYYALHEGSQPVHSSLKALFASTRLRYFTVFAFLIGFLLTVPIIYMEIHWKVFAFDTVSMENLLRYFFWLTVLIVIEFYLLFILGFYLLSYYIYHIYHMYRDEVGYIKEEAFLAMLGRTVMELPEKNIVKFNVDHQEHSDRERLIWALLYKIKVVLTNAVLKFAMKKILTRTSFRVYSPYVAALGTGAWDAFVFYKTAKESHYKITVRFVILYLLAHKQELLLKEVHLKAMLARYFYYGEYNNNFDFLLTQLYEVRPFHYSKEAYLDPTVIQKSNPKLLLLLYAFKEKIYTKREKEIIKTLDSEGQGIKLRRAFRFGDLAYLYAYVSTL